MRLYKCVTLTDYIKQLEHDLEVLKGLAEKSKAEPSLTSFNVNEYNVDRDTYENHAEAISKHTELMRAARRSSNE